MIYEMNKPSKNMLLSQRELDKMYMEQQNEYFSNNNREDEILKEQGIYNRAVNEHAVYLNEYANRQYIDTNKRVAFLQKAKESLLKAKEDSLEYLNSNEYNSDIINILDNSYNLD